MSQENPSIAIIVPTLNEAENVGPLVSQINASGVSFSEIIFVDDGSTDGTRDVIRELISSARVRLVERDAGARGLAGAIVAGAESSTAELVVVMDADLSHPPAKLCALLQPLLANEADLVIGSRYVPGGATPDWPAWRRIISRSASALAYPLTGVHDAMCGFFAVRRLRLLHLARKASGFKIAFEIIVRGGRNLRVREVPILFHDRTRGESKMCLREALQFAIGWSGALLRRRRGRRQPAFSSERDESPLISPAKARPPA